MNTWCADPSGGRYHKHPSLSKSVAGTRILPCSTESALGHSMDPLWHCREDQIFAVLYYSLGESTIRNREARLPHQGNEEGMTKQELALQYIYFV
jgi:hypothetical protein